MNFKASIRGVGRTEDLPYELLAMLGLTDKKSQEVFIKTTKKLD